MPEFDVVILTDERYINPFHPGQYVQNILLEDKFVLDALSGKELRVTRKAWTDPNFDWSETKAVLFRTTWDYTHRIHEFNTWISDISVKTQLINSKEIIEWNINKRYLAELEKQGVRIVPTKFIESGSGITLKELHAQNNWDETVLKPVFGAGGRNTYLIQSKNRAVAENRYRKLIEQEDLMIQPFQKSIREVGEWSFMIFGGEFSHAVIKKAREGEFRVQDDFGGKVFFHEATPQEIEFAINAAAKCPGNPAYARVDVVLDNEGEYAVSEIELIEPELWFRFKPEAASLFAENIINALGN